MIPGFHGTEEEVNFVFGIVNGVIRPYYRGPIQLVGSRSIPDNPSWISTVKYYSFCRRLDPGILEYWFNWLNERAKTLQYNRKQIPLLVDELPQSAPKVICDFLETERTSAGSDFDLFIEERPSVIVKVYRDEKVTGQQVEIWTPNDLL